MRDQLPCDVADWKIEPSDLSIDTERKLGEGTFASAYLATWRGVTVVAKVFNEFSRTAKLHLLLREIDTMTKLHHPGIVQTFGYVEEPFVLVIEYCPRGDLLANLHRLSRSDVLRVMDDTLSSLVYLHNRRPKNLIHRDIKLTNLLLTATKKTKVADFGLSRATASGERDLSNVDLEGLANEPELTASVGSARYLAPEMPCSTYSSKIDVYSLGIVFYELHERRRYDPQKGLQWQRTPAVMRVFILEMLMADPCTRRSAAELLVLFRARFSSPCSSGVIARLLGRMRSPRVRF
jgi:serine/threonine protein kinase